MFWYVKGNGLNKNFDNIIYIGIKKYSYLIKFFNDI